MNKTISPEEHYKKKLSEHIYKSYKFTKLSKYLRTEFCKIVVAHEPLTELRIYCKNVSILLFQFSDNNITRYISLSKVASDETLLDSLDGIILSRLCDYNFIKPVCKLVKK